MEDPGGYPNWEHQTEGKACDDEKTQVEFLGKKLCFRGAGDILRGHPHILSQVGWSSQIRTDIHLINSQVLCRVKLPTTVVEPPSDDLGCFGLQGQGGHQSTQPHVFSCGDVGIRTRVRQRADMRFYSGVDTYHPRSRLSVLPTPKPNP